MATMTFNSVIHEIVDQNHAHGVTKTQNAFY